MDISACILVKNEEKYLANCIQSVITKVNEVIVVDDNSTDNTKGVAYSLGAKVFNLKSPVCEVGFANASNEMFSYATKEWILFIDADEILDPIGDLHSLTRVPSANAWVLPRRKWIDYKKQIREEYYAYPDWQVRFFRRSLGPRFFIGEMHNQFLHPRNYSYRGPHIEHLQKECRDQEKILHREILYSDLASRQGVAIHRGTYLAKEKE